MNDENFSNHRNLVQLKSLIKVFDGEDEENSKQDRMYLVMEMCEGGDLSKFINLKKDQVKAK